MDSMDPIWHPYTQEAIAGRPLHVKSAGDEFLYLDDGRKLIDAVSSWWTITHGHCNEEIMEAVAKQAKELDHVIFAGFSHDRALEVARKLLDLLPGNQAKVFFSDNGSTAVEIAVKMAVQYHYNRGVKRKVIIALEGAFHGETFGAMSISDRHGFDAAFVPYLFDVKRIPVPEADTLEECIALIEHYNSAGAVAAFIFEPLVMGAGGMKMYEAMHLDHLLQYCRENSILTIADEVMTGFGRTGRIFATDHCVVKPDIICLAKGLSGGVLPVAVTTCTREIYGAFYSSEKRKAFYHGHSFTGNPLACAAASANLDIVARPGFLDTVRRISNANRSFAEEVKRQFPAADIRVQGTILAVNFKSGEEEAYFSDLKEELAHYFMDNNVFIRPLGNVLYIMPPYCISETSLGSLHALFLEALKMFYGKN